MVFDGVVKVFKLVRAKLLNPLIIENCLQILFIFSGESDQKYQRFLVQQGVVSFIQELLNHFKDNEGVYTQILYLIANLTKHELPNLSSILGILVQNLQQYQESERYYVAIRGIFNISNYQNQIKGLLDCNIHQIIVQKLEEENDPTQLAILLRILQNLIFYDSYFNSWLIQSNVFQSFKRLLKKQKERIKFLVLFILSNIITEGAPVIQILIENGLLEMCLDFVGCSSASIRKEISIIINNVLQVGEDYQAFHLLKVGYLQKLIQGLDNEPSPDVLFNELVAINQFLQIGKRNMILTKTAENNQIAMDFYQMGGIEKLEKLQQHENRQIYHFVVKIMEDFFGLEDNKENIQVFDVFNIPKEGFKFK